MPWVRAQTRMPSTALTVMSNMLPTTVALDTPLPPVNGTAVTVRSVLT